MSGELDEIRKRHTVQDPEGDPFCLVCRDHDGNAIDWPCDTAIVLAALDDVRKMAGAYSEDRDRLRGLLERALPFIPVHLSSTTLHYEIESALAEKE